MVTISFRNPQLLILTIAFAVNVFACRPVRQNELAGIWAVVSVQADFDERKVNPQTFNQVMAYLKDTSLEFRSDTALSIHRGGMQIMGKWQKDASIGIIRIEAEGIGFKSLRKQGEQLHTSELTPVGKIAIVFEKLDR